MSVIEQAGSCFGKKRESALPAACERLSSCGPREGCCVEGLWVWRQMEGIQVSEGHEVL